MDKIDWNSKASVEAAILRGDFRVEKVIAQREQVAIWKKRKA